MGAFRGVDKEKTNYWTFDFPSPLLFCSPYSVCHPVLNLLDTLYIYGTSGEMNENIQCVREKEEVIHVFKTLAKRQSSKCRE